MGFCADIRMTGARGCRRPTGTTKRQRQSVPAGRRPQRPPPAGASGGKAEPQRSAAAPRERGGRCRDARARGQRRPGKWRMSPGPSRPARPGPDTLVTPPTASARNDAGSGGSGGLGPPKLLACCPGTASGSRARGMLGGRPRMSAVMLPPPSGKGLVVTLRARLCLPPSIYALKGWLRFPKCLAALPRDPQTQTSAGAPLKFALALVIACPLPASLPAWKRVETIQLMPLTRGVHLSFARLILASTGSLQASVPFLSWFPARLSCSLQWQTPSHKT